MEYRVGVLNMIINYSLCPHKFAIFSIFVRHFNFTHRIMKISPTPSSIFIHTFSLSFNIDHNFNVPTTFLIIVSFHGVVGERSINDQRIVWKNYYIFNNNNDVTLIQQNKFSIIHLNKPCEWTNHEKNLF